MSPWAIQRLSKEILKGAVFAYPTDSIWGFGCHPQIPSSVYHILNIKQRSVEKGLILLASDWAHIEMYLSKKLTPDQTHCLQMVYPQPTTWLVEASIDCPIWLRGHFQTIAVRLTNHALVRAICTNIQSPLVSTSANRAGGPTVRSALQAQRQFGAELDYIVTGFDSGENHASVIKSLDSGHRLR